MRNPTFNTPDRSEVQFLMRTQNFFFESFLACLKPGLIAIRYEF